MISQSAVVEDLDLRCSHGEANTRMVLHANHVPSSSYNSDDSKRRYRCFCYIANSSHIN